MLDERVMLVRGEERREGKMQDERREERGEDGEMLEKRGKVGRTQDWGVEE